MPFALFLALKYLKPKRSVTSAVTVFSVLGVVLGVAIVIIVRAVMTGFGDMWREKILAFKPHVTIQAQQGWLDREEALCRRLEALPGVVAASPGIETRVLAEYHRRILAPIVIGVDPERAGRMLQATNLVEGSLDLSGDGVVLGIDMARSLGVMVGDSILLHSPMNLIHTNQVRFPEELTVRGIYEAGQRDFDSEFIITSLGVARDLMGMRQGAMSIHVKTADPQNIQVFDACVAAIRGELGPNYAMQTWQTVDRVLFNALAVEKNMMVILLMFITIVAIFCVTVTLIVISVQKTDEIGLLKALGFSSRQVLWTFVLYGWIQCFLGTALGIGLAYLVLHNLQHLVDALAACGVQVFPKSIYGLDHIPWRVIPSEIAQVAVAVIAFCSLASFFPAWRAARMDPVQALRRE
jgi:lipoprotein-releasing system permease protein